VQLNSEMYLYISVRFFEWTERWWICNKILQIMSKRKKFPRWKKENFMLAETVMPWRHF